MNRSGRLSEAPTKPASINSDTTDIVQSVKIAFLKRHGRPLTMVILKSQRSWLTVRFQIVSNFI
jgi:hypothetical protein